MFSVSTILIFCALIASVILLVRLMVQKDQNRFSSWVFIFYILFQSFSNLLYVLIDTGWITQVWFLYRIPAPLTLAIAPLGYFYVRSMLRDEDGLRAHDSWHFLPALAGAINYLPYFFSSSEIKIQTVRNLTEGFSKTIVGQDGLLPDEIMSFIRITQGIFYVFLHIKLHRESEFFSNKNLSLFEKKLRNWLTGFSVVVSVQYVAVFVVILTFIIINLLSINVTDSSQVQVFVASNGVIIFLSYLYFASYLLIYPEVTIGKMVNTIKPSRKSSSPATSDSAEKLAPATIEEKAIVDRLKHLLHVDRIWQNPDLDLYILAQQANCSLRQTSYILNNFFQGNFNAVVNQCRVEFAMQLIEKGYLTEYTIDSLWKECGFRNHVTFYSAFKKEKGMTPLEYDKSLQIKK